jgi:hypothetical protein
MQGIRRGKRFATKGANPMRGVLAWLVLLLSVFPVPAAGGPSDKEMKNANNPLADLTAFNIQNYYQSDLNGLADETANTTWLRFVKPVGRWLGRASLPFNYRPDGSGGTSSGMGDLNIFEAYLLTDPDASQTVGVGPLAVIPTSTNDVLSSRKYQLGAAAVYFNMKSRVLQWGGLVTYQRSVAGSSAASDVSLAVVQPFAIFQIGNGVYLRGAPLWVFDLENDTYNVPFGLGVGKVLKDKGTVFNLFIEPQWAMFNKGVGNPGFQLFAGVNLQFVR